jgi:hypothetical protein
MESSINSAILDDAHEKKANCSFKSTFFLFSSPLEIESFRDISLLAV